MRLKREHDKLVVGLGLGGGIVTIGLCFVLLAIADEMGRLVGGAFVGLVALAAAVCFVSSFFPRYSQTFERSFATQKPIDPATGSPLRMLWFFRWFAAVLSVFMFAALGDYVQPQPESLPPTSAASPAVSSAGADSLQAPLNDVERNAGIAAICVTTAGYLTHPDLGPLPFTVAVAQAKAFVPSDPRMGWVVSHLLVWLYKRGPSRARSEELNQLARQFNNPKGVTPLTEVSWDESDCEASEEAVGATTQAPPPDSVRQVFASETR